MTDEGQARAEETVHAPPRRTKARKNWRDWPLTMKVVAVMAIPVLAAAGLAVWTLLSHDIDVVWIAVAVALGIALVASALVAVVVAKQIRREIDKIRHEADEKARREAERVEAEQAGMRTAYSAVFVNLSRRSQGLVQRQLSLIEQLERDEEDGDRLATLFQLDHLATRMRRNNENLVMLSGAEPTRRGGKPVSAADVVRAAVSEIEQYQRVTVKNPPATHFAGHAASDLMRLLAELLENATTFSPPESQVSVAGTKNPSGGMTVEVVDSGISMSDDELARANARMTKAPSMEMVTSKRMGLFVVGRLASKHKVGVTLARGEGGKGIRATVIVPPELVVKPVAALPAKQPTDRPTPHKRPPAEEAAQQDAGAKENADPSGKALFAPVADDGADVKPTEAVQYRRQKKAGAQPSVRVPGKGARPDAGGEVPSGKELFKPEIAPLSDWWKSEQAKGQPVPGQRASSGASTAERDDTKANKGTEIGEGVRMRREGTPIFDQLSAWFTDQKPAPKEDAAEPAEADAKTEAPGSDPTKAAIKGADAAKTKPDAAKTEAEEKADKKPATKADTAKSATKPGAKKPEATKPDAKKTAKPTEDAKPAPEKSWKSATDSQWREVAKVTEQPQSAKVTEAGLPKRDRGAQLLPGAAANAKKPQPKDSTQDDTGVRSRDPEAARSRLSSFQRGVKRGKYDANVAKAEPTTADPKTNGTAPSKPPLPKRPATGKPGATKPSTTDADAAPDKTKPSSNVPRPRKSEPHQPDGATDPWEFSSAAAWEEAKAVADARPAQFTEKGLPKRKRGERLMPGGPVKANARQPQQTSAARPSRDPNVVRNRLSGFQQGVRRGKQGSAEPNDDTGVTDGPAQVSGGNKEEK